MPEGGDREMMSFETLTFVPIDKRLVDPSRLSSFEIAWLDGYHAAVMETAAGGLDEADRKWLEQATAPLER